VVKGTIELEGGREKKYHGNARRIIFKLQVLCAFNALRKIEVKSLSCISEKSF
jgi:hypothetical protein